MLKDTILFALSRVSSTSWKKLIKRRQNLSLQSTSPIKFYQPEEDPSKGRSSRPEVFCKKGVFRKFAKFKGKHLCQRLFFNKVAGMRPATLLKKNLWYRCFPLNFAKFLRTPFFTEHLWWLLLKVSNLGRGCWMLYMFSC